jgi:hypothetical protein
MGSISSAPGAFTKDFFFIIVNHPFYVEASVKKTLLLFDLDDTLMIQEPIAARTVLDIAKTLSNEDIEPELFARRFWETTERLWSHQPFLSTTKNLGISAGEGLWGDFNTRERRWS